MARLKREPSANRKQKKRKPAGIVLCAMLVLLTALIGIAAALGGNAGLIGASIVKPQNNNNEEQHAGINDSPPSITDEAEQLSDPDLFEEVKIELPSELRAVTLAAGQDYSFSVSNDDWKYQIDEAIDIAHEMGMNAVVMETAIRSAGNDEGLQLLNDYEPIAYAVQSARSREMHSLAILHVTNSNLDEKSPKSAEPLDARVVDHLDNAAVGLAKTLPDAILIDGYYHVEAADSFSSYLKTGSLAGYETYLSELPLKLVNYAHDLIKSFNPAIKVGLVTEPVWANHEADERGSYTNSDFSALLDGNIDTIALLENKAVDLLAVKAWGSLDDPKIPYHSVTKWWNDIAEKTNTPMFVIHASNRAVSDEIGWSEYDQLARQVIVARELSSYSGSVFNCLNRLIENPKDCAGKLQGYYEGTVSAEHILTDLELTQPAKMVFTSLNPSVLFAGNTDPNTEATINDVPIVTDENGYFSLEMPLKEGENIFIISHKGKTEQYKITRVVEVVREVAPTGKLAADGATKLTITAVAYEKAKVYAVVNNQTVEMTMTDETDDNGLRDTTYRRFVGIYTIPEPTTSVQELGNIVVYGEWDGYKKSKTAASLSVNPKALPSDGRPVMVVSDWAETFPSTTVSHYSDPSYFPLPKGALDYAIGKEIRYSVTDENNKQKVYSFYRLQSGLRVLTDDITVVGTSRAPVDNVITRCDVESDSRYTYLTLKSSQSVSYTARYTPEAVSVQFHYTKALPQSMQLKSNPLFSSVEFAGDKMTLTLKSRGIFLGVYSYYDSEGNLVFRFNNPPVISGSSLRGVKIVLDPGHGGIDSGAAGYLGTHPENVVNYLIAGKLASVLQSRGAEVVMYDTRSNTISLEQRARMAAAADPHIFLSIHANSSAYNRAAAGSEAYYFNPFSYALAQLAASHTASSLNTVNRGGKFGYYYVTRSMQYPAVLIETGFMSNQAEYSKLVNSSYQNQIATGIANAVVSYLKLMGENAGATGSQHSVWQPPAQPSPSSSAQTAQASESAQPAAAS